MKKLLMILLALTLLLGIAAAAAEEAGELGQPFPDFTVTDTEGNTFTLSEALKDHDAVLINFWATWCGPCKNEFPFLKDLYEKYGDKVAYIALSPAASSGDTMEMVAEYHTAYEINFPMGLDEDASLFNYVGAGGYPTTAIVDRFGNYAFVHVGAFINEGEAERVIKFFIGDDYTETTVLAEIPKDDSTTAYPVASKRAVHVENENAKAVIFHVEGEEETFLGYIIPDETAHLRIDLGIKDTVGNMVLSDPGVGIVTVESMYDAERGAFVYDQQMPAADAEIQYTAGMLCDVLLAYDDPDYIIYYLTTSEDHIEDLVNGMGNSGVTVTWEYAEDAGAGEELQAYIVHIVDQDGNPVPGVFINFCTDVACELTQSDENGIITFAGEPDVYHLQLLKVPEGYSFDGDFEMYTEKTYSEWVLRIKKD